MGIPTRVHQSACSWNVPAEQAAFQHRSKYIRCPLISNETVIQPNKKKTSIKKTKNITRGILNQVFLSGQCCISALFLHLLACVQLLNGKGSVERSHLIVCAGLHPSKVSCFFLWLPLSLPTAHCHYNSMPSPLLFVQRIPFSCCIQTIYPSVMEKIFMSFQSYTQTAPKQCLNK